MGAEQVCVGAQLGPVLERSWEHLPPSGAWAGEEDAETWSGSCFLRWDAEAQGMRVVTKCGMVRRETWTPDLIWGLLCLCLKQCLCHCGTARVTLEVMLCNGCAERSLAGSASGVVGVCKGVSRCCFAGNFLYLHGLGFWLVSRQRQL